MSLHLSLTFQPYKRCLYKPWRPGAVSKKIKIRCTPPPPNYDCRTMTALPVLMFQIESLRMYCSYSHAYIILLEAGTGIHASYANNLYDPK